MSAHGVGPATDASGELVLATLWLAPSDARLAALRAAAAADRVDWDAALVALEAHGVVGLAQRNLELAAAPTPEPVRAALRARAAVMRALEAGTRLTLERFLAAAARRGIEPTLLKGAALAQDLYPPGGLRAQADLDLLVAPGEVREAVAAAREIGLDLPPRAFPAWWHRLAHFHLKLAPRDPLQRELELHWHLHPESALLTVRLADLRARRRPVEPGGVLGAARAWTLDPLDRLLHLATHLARHAPLAGLDRPALRAVAAEPRHPLRLKWLLDVLAEVEARHAELDAAALAARALEWSAAPALVDVLGALHALAPAASAAAWAARVRALLPVAADAADTRSAARAGERPLAGLDLRGSALGALPRWAVPPREWLARTAGDASAPTRVAHGVGVLARVGLAALSVPPAWLAGRLRRTPRATEDPQLLLELAAAARRIERGAPDPEPGAATSS